MRRSHYRFTTHPLERKKTSRSQRIEARWTTYHSPRQEMSEATGIVPEVPPADQRNTVP